MKRLIGICAILFLLVSCAKQEPYVLKIAHVGHDHHAALYVACLEGERFKNDYGLYLKEIKPKELYELYEGNKKIAELELYKVGGGSEMPTLMSQGHFEIGFGGIAAELFFVDKQAPIKVISPLHGKGDMLVVPPNIPVSNWNEFVQWVKNSPKQIRVGYKDPVAVAKIIFESALKEEGVEYTNDPGNKKAKVVLINMKGEKNLIPGLENKLIDCYISNNPWCALAEEKGSGKIIAELSNLPPHIWKEHPCCTIAATDSAINAKGPAIIKFLELITIATEYINKKPEIGYNAASKWIGTSLSVEQKSMSTSEYSTEPSKEWKEAIYMWCQKMSEMGEFKGILKDKEPSEIDRLALDLTLIEQARKNFEKRKK